MKQKQKAQLQEERARQLQNEIENTTGYHEYPPDPNQSPVRSPLEAAHNFTMNKIQFVQYECIKSELRAEYDKRVNYLHKRIQRQNAKQGPYQDAHLILMQNNTTDMNDLERPGHRVRRSGFDVTPSEPNNLSLPGMGKPSNTFSQGAISRNKNTKRQTCDGVRNRGVSNDRDQHYKIFLESAQRALEDMRKKQKT